MAVSFQQDTYTIIEGDGEVEVCVVLDGVINRDVAVELSTQDGTAGGQIL